MDTIKLPYSDVEISRIGFGAWPIVGGFNWGPQDEKDSVDALESAIEMGINFFDTAKVYGGGKSEELITRVLGGKRKELVLATKISPEEFRYQDLKDACEDRMQSLNTDYIDLLQLHWPNWDIPIEQPFSALMDLKKEGKIRAYGVSNFGVRDLKDALALEGVEISSNQLPYNLLWRAIEFEILPLCNEHNIPVLPYMPIMQGLLAGSFKHPDELAEDRARSRHFSSKRPQTRHGEDGCEEETFEAVEALRQFSVGLGISMVEMSLAWLLYQEGVGSVIVGARNRRQVLGNAKAIDVALKVESLARMDVVTEQLKQILGANPDLWQHDSRYR